MTSDPVTAYADAVLAGRTVAGPYVRHACRRHRADLDTGAARGLVFDPAAVERVVGFFRHILRFPDGDRAGTPFDLEPWQAFVVGSLFGWKRAADGLRRFRTAYVETGKGSGKSPLGAGVGLYMLTADGETGAECYCAAVSRDQAKIAFRDASRMVTGSPALSRRIQCSGQRDIFNLAHLASGSFFRPISSEGRALDGKRVHFALLDEIHEHPSPVVVNKITAGLKGLKQPLIFEITNSGYDRTSICWQHHQYSTEVVSGVVQDDEWFAYVCGLDEEDDPLVDPSCWAKANPTLGVTIKPEYLEKQVREAVNMPSNESIVRRLNFCQWVDAASPWIDGDLWRACEAEFDLDDLAERPCWGGLDLSGTRDLTALALVWPGDDGNLDAALWYWTPGDTLTERARRDSVPYEAWVRAGHLDGPPGRAVKYDFVAATIADLAARFDVRGIAYDPYRIKYLEPELDAEGVAVPLLAHGQGYYHSSESGLWMPRSVELLEGAALDGRLRVRKNPVLTWNSASAVLEADPKGSRIFTKRKSTGRIDGIVALAMAIGASSEDAGVDFDDFVNNPVIV